MNRPTRIPLDQIATTLPRDRTMIDAPALAELQASITANGLRLPIELAPHGAGYTLISGLRRLSAFQNLHALTQDEKYATIPALIRNLSPAQALAAMVEENEIRQNLSPWERAHITWATTDQGLFETLDAAIQTLFPHSTRQKRSKLRAMAEVVAALNGQLINPEDLSEAKLLRLAGALRHGWGDILTHCIGEQKDHSAQDQWDRLAPILAELEERITKGRGTHPNRPRRLSRPKRGLNIRRERTPYGYCLYITGRQATDALVENVLEQVEHLLTDD